MAASVYQLTSQLGQQLIQRSWQLVTAESCTGGGIAQQITEVPGSSAWYERGFVTYSNISKHEMLGVSPLTLEKYGAVSSQTAKEMVEGALAHSHADLGVAVTGVAGPGGGTLNKPVGTVYIAWQVKSQSSDCGVFHFSGDRSAIRQQTVYQALQILSHQLADY